MKTKILWKDIVYEDTIRGINFSKIIDFAYAWKEKSPGRFVSNVGGWQSEDYLRHSFKCNELDTLIQCINKKFKRYKVSIDELWININQTNSFNEIHDHLGTTLSGVVYLNATEEMGNIVFLKNTNLQYMSPNEVEMYSVEYPSITRKMYVFSASIPHYVIKNTTLTDRISVSFNLKE